MRATFWPMRRMAGVVIWVKLNWRTNLERADMVTGRRKAGYGEAVVSA